MNEKLKNLLININKLKQHNLDEKFILDFAVTNLENIYNDSEKQYKDMSDFQDEMINSLVDEMTDEFPMEE